MTVLMDDLKGKYDDVTDGTTVRKSGSSGSSTVNVYMSTRVFRVHGHLRKKRRTMASRRLQRLIVGYRPSDLLNVPSLTVHYTRSICVVFVVDNIFLLFTESAACQCIYRSLFLLSLFLVCTTALAVRLRSTLNKRPRPRKTRSVMRVCAGMSKFYSSYSSSPSLWKHPVSYSTVTTRTT